VRLSVEDFRWPPAMTCCHVLMAGGNWDVTVTSGAVACQVMSAGCWNRGGGGPPGRRGERESERGERERRETTGYEP